MISDISALTSSASFWDTVSVVSAIAVFAGVGVESVADFDVLARWTRLDAAPDRRKKIANRGLMLLISALAIEVLAAIGSRNVNAEIVATLNGELDQTVQHDLQLTKLTKSLGFSNRALQREVADQADLLLKASSGIDSLATQNADVAISIASQKAGDRRALALLKDDEDRLIRARSDMLANAARAANAADIANKAQSDMTTALNDVKAMRARLQDIITPRQIDDVHYEALVTALKKFPNTPVDFALTRDVDSLDLLVRISDAVKAAGWKILPFEGGGLGLNISSRPDLPNIGEVTGRAVQVSISLPDAGKLADPANALLKALGDAGIGEIASAIPDKMPDGTPNPHGVKAGVIHVVVGTKP